MKTAPILLCAYASLFGCIYTAVTGNVTYFRLGNYNFQTSDLIIYLALFLIGLNIHAIKIRTGALPVLILVYFSLFFVNFMRGISDSLASALFDTRTQGVIPIILLLSVVSRYEAKDLEKLKRAIVSTGIILSALVLLRNLFGLSLFYSNIYDASGINDGGRALAAPAALMIGAAFCVTLSGIFRPGSKNGYKEIAILAALLAALVATFQGTASIATVAASIVIIALSPGRAAGLRLSLVLGATLGATLVLMLAPDALSERGILSILPPDIVFQLSRRSANLGTRIAVWTAFEQYFAHRDLAQQMFGLPLGKSPEIYIQNWGGTNWTRSLHSNYYAIVADYGIAGLATTVMIGLATVGANLRRLVHRDATLSIALTLAIAVFSYSYELGRDESAILLLATCLAMGITPLPLSKRHPPTSCSEAQRKSS